MAQQSPKKTKPKRGALSLRLDGPLLTPEAFRTAVGAFVDLLQSVTEEIAAGGEKPVWTMSVKSGSTILIATPVDSIPTRASARRVLKSVKKGVQLLESGKTEAPGFNHLAMAAASKLYILRNREKDRIPIFQITTTTGDGKPDSKPCDIKPKGIEFLNRLRGLQHQACGSIEGKLQTISARIGFQFVVYDALFNLGVNCFLEKSLMNVAISAFGKRVCVSGMVQYDKAGRPVSIKADSIRVLRTIAEIGPVDQFQGILAK